MDASISSLLRQPEPRVAPASTLMAGCVDVSAAFRGELLSLGWLAARGQSFVLLPSDVCVLWIHLPPRSRRGTNDARNAPKPRLAGLQTSPSLLLLPTTGWLLAAVLSLPAALSAFGTPLGATADTNIVLERTTTASALTELQERIGAHDSAAQAALSLGAWLERHLRGAAMPVPIGGLRVLMAAEQLSAADRAPSLVAQMPAALGVTRRQLERDFRHWCGASPGVYTRLIRLQRTVHVLAEGVALGPAAVSLGYADPSHLSRVVHATSLMTPREIRRYGASPGHSHRSGARAGRLLWIDAAESNLDPSALRTLRRNSLRAAQEVEVE